MVSRKTIGEVMGGHYIIPDFQRDYAWKEENMDLMLDDIIIAMEEKGKESSYSLGPLVVYADKDKYKVIDGQQRLTSITLVLIALGEEPEFLEFENRQGAVETIEGLKRRRAYRDSDIAAMSPASKRIYEMYIHVRNYFDYLGKDKQEDFKSSFKEKVSLIEKVLPEDAQIQHTFEVLNTVGEQLKNEDIAKARILSLLIKDKDLCNLFNYAWLKCCDIENDLSDADIKTIKTICEANEFEAKLCQGIQSQGESGDVRLKDIVEKAKRKKAFSRSKIGSESSYQNGCYTVCLTPVELIDVALSAEIKGCSISKIAKAKDIASLFPAEKAFEAIKSMLRHRYVFDRFVVKRYKNSSDWMLSDGQTNKRLIMVESMLAVAGTEAAKQLLSITAEKTKNTFALSDPLAEELITDLEKYAQDRASHIVNNDGLDWGTRTQHFIFYWLDYLLYLAITKGSCNFSGLDDAVKSMAERFAFTNTTSIEHLQPQHPLDGKDLPDEWRESLDSFGNLALISTSMNSRLNNSSPEEKVGIFGNQCISLKYSLMLKITSADGWSVAACKKHGEEMKKLLREGYLEVLKQ